MPPLSSDATIEEALADGYIQDNLQTRMLCGDPRPFGEVDEGMLEQAKANLTERLVCFGMTEVRRVARARETEARHRQHPLPRPRPGQRGAPRGADVPESLTEAAAACNTFDLELYAHAREVFDAVPDLGQLDFQVEVAALAAAKGEGEIDLDLDAPAAFGGNEADWRLLLGAQAQLARTELALARKNTPRGSGRAQRAALTAELEATRTKNKTLADELEARKSELRELRTAQPANGTSGGNKARGTNA